jgi:chromosome segregation ATPase
MASSIEGKKKKKTKLEKICELESSIKILTEQNNRLKTEVRSLRASKASEDASIVSEFTDGASVGGSVGGNEEKLKEALRALKRVTVKQEMSLKTLRSKTKQRRAEIEQKEQIIEKLEEETRSLKKAHEKLRGVGTDDLSSLKARVADLELHLAREEAGNEEQSKKLKESTQDIISLRDQLEKMRGRVKRAPSSRSLRSSDSVASAASEDVAKIKRELANKIEKIANLEYDLEAGRDEIHELKRKNQFDESFPVTPAPGMDDFFSDEDEEADDFWGK